MGTGTAKSFSCIQCGKSYPWKPSLAGRKARCTCGAVLVVPSAPMAAPGDDDLYAMAEPANPEPVHAIPIVQPPRTRSLAYARPSRERRAADSLTSVPRDVYAPTGLLAAGFLAIFAWALTHDANAAVMGILSVLTCTAVVIKTLLLIGIALVAAPRMGLSFGTLKTAVLKFAGIIIFTDAALLWLEVAMIATGAISPRGRVTLGTGTINLLAATAIMAILIRFLFDMDRDEVAMVALPLAFLSRLIGFGFWLVLLVIVRALVAQMAPPPPTAVPATPPPPPANTTPANATPVNPAPALPGTAADAALLKHIRGNPLVREAREQQLNTARGQRPLVEQALGAGARKIYFDLQASRKMQPTLAYVELPPSDPERTACLDALGSVCKDYGFQMPPIAEIDPNQRFITIKLTP